MAVRLFDTSTLEIGDVLPHRMAKTWGPVVAIESDDRCRWAVFANGSEMTIGWTDESGNLVPIVL